MNYDRVLFALVLIVLIVALSFVSQTLIAQKGKSESQTSQEFTGVSNAATPKAKSFNGRSDPLQASTEW